MIENAPQVVHYPLTDRRGQIFLRVCAECTGDSNQNDSDNGEVKNTNLIETKSRTKQSCHPHRQMLRAEHVVEDNFQRPGFEQIGDRLTQHREERKREHATVRSQQVSELYFFLWHNRATKKHKSTQNVFRSFCDFCAFFVANSQRRSESFWRRARQPAE